MNAAAGTLVLTGSNIGTGATTLTTGTLQFDNATNGGLAGTGGPDPDCGHLAGPQRFPGRFSNPITYTLATVSGAQSLSLTGSFRRLSALPIAFLTCSITGGNLLTIGDGEVSSVFLSNSSTVAGGVDHRRAPATPPWLATSWTSTGLALASPVLYHQHGYHHPQRYEHLYRP